jgi:uncharacterized membrane protein
MPQGNRLARILRHRWADLSDVRSALDAAALKRVEDRVAASERHHRGEIRVCVEAGLPWSYLWKRLTARDRAIMLFSKLRVWDTAENSGVLIYLLMAEHAIEIVADRGLNAHVSPAQWQAIVQTMRAAFRAGRFEDGLNAAIDAVDALLAQHFPATPGADNTNELSNVPWVG